MTPAALDITIAIILLLSALVAYFRGIIREAFTIVALIVATGTTYFGGEMMIQPFNKWLKVDVKGEEAAAAVSKAAATGADTSIIAKAHLFMGVLSYEKLAIICAYASVFIFFYLVMSLVGFFVSRAVNEAGLGLADKILGGAFGLARGALVVLLCFLPISFMIDQEKFPDWAKNSVSVPILQQSVAYIDEKIDLKKRIADTGKEALAKIKDYKRPEGKQTSVPVIQKVLREEDVAPPDGEEEDLKRELLSDERTAPPPSR